MKIIIRTLVLLISLNLTNLYAAELISGKITKVYADPSDIVYIIGAANSGPCGSNYYHIRRSNENFKEFNSLILTAFTAGKSVSVQQTECSGDRSITSHGATY